MRDNVIQGGSCLHPAAKQNQVMRDEMQDFAPPLYSTRYLEIWMQPASNASRLDARQSMPKVRIRALELEVRCGAPVGGAACHPAVVPCPRVQHNTDWYTSYNTSNANPKPNVSMYVPQTTKLPLQPPRPRPRCPSISIWSGSVNFGRVEGSLAGPPNPLGGRVLPRVRVLL